MTCLCSGINSLTCKFFAYVDEVSAWKLRKLCFCSTSVSVCKISQKVTKQMLMIFSSARDKSLAFAEDPEFQILSWILDRFSQLSLTSGWLLILNDWTIHVKVGTHLPRLLCVCVLDVLSCVLLIWYSLHFALYFILACDTASYKRPLWSDSVSVAVSVCNTAEPIDSSALHCKACTIASHVAYRLVFSDLASAMLPLPIPLSSS